ncbi:MAG: hypothetical protein MJ202_03450 [Lentisphaeria bacterium]|nr:hypothetical protein [Lentisphaeria bacterium]
MAGENVVKAGGMPSAIGKSAPVWLLDNKGDEETSELGCGVRKKFSLGEGRMSGAIVWTEAMRYKINTDYIRLDVDNETLLVKFDRRFDGIPKASARNPYGNMFAEGMDANAMLARMKEFCKSEEPVSEIGLNNFPESLESIGAISRNGTI